jgi:hypothetical protein
MPTAAALSFQSLSATSSALQSRQPPSAPAIAASLPAFGFELPGTVLVLASCLRQR